MRGQAAVGLFLILIGVLIFAYWILLPATEKQKILEELYNQTIKTNYSISKQKVKKNEIGNLILSKSKIKYVIADGYTIGKFVKIGEYNYGNFYLSSDIFSGSSIKSFAFSFPKGDGIEINFLSKCKNCNIEIYLNDYLIYKGSPKNSTKIFVPKEYLDKKNIIIFKLNPPLNPFFKSEIEVKNFKIKYLEKNYINYEFYYTNGKVLLEYDFCPNDPSTIHFYINNQMIPIPTCSSSLYNSPIDITRYLKTGYNKIIIKADNPTKVSFTLVINNDKFYAIVNLNRGIIIPIIRKGKGLLIFNGAKFIINEDSYQINVENYLKEENVLIIKADPYLEIEKIILV